MKLNKTTLLICLLVSILRIAYADDCQPNGLGGTFCVNDDGTTSSSTPNDAGGKDTVSSDGKSTSTFQDGTGIEYTLSDKGVTAKPSQDEALNDPPSTRPNVSPNDTSGPKPDASANALLGSHWNTLSSDGDPGGAAASQSSIKLDDSGTSKWP